MKQLSLLLSLCLLGCATTTFFNANGQKLLTTQADLTNVRFSSNGLVFTCDSMIHSVPTLAGGTAAAGDINALAALASVIGTSVNGVSAARAAVTVGATAGSVVNNPPAKSSAIANAAVQPAVQYRRLHHATSTPSPNVH